MWEIVVKQKPNAKLIIMGRDPSNNRLYEKKIKGCVEKQKLNQNIIFTGFVWGEKKYQIMKQCKIFIFPSYWESFGQAVCQAMACGLPVVAYDLPCYREFYENDVTTVKKGNTSGLAKESIKLLKNKKLRKKMSRIGKIRSKKYNWDNVSIKKQKIIKTIL